MEHAHQESVLLLGVVLALILTVRDAKLMEWSSGETKTRGLKFIKTLKDFENPRGNSHVLFLFSPVSGDLGVQRLLDETPPLDLLFSLLDLRHDTVNVLELGGALPENFRVFDNLVNKTFSMNTTIVTTAENPPLGGKFTITGFPITEIGSLTSSGVFPSTSLEILSISSLPYFSCSRIN